MVEINDPFWIAIIGIIGGIIGSAGSYFIVYRFEHKKERLQIKEKISAQLSECFNYYNKGTHNLLIDAMKDYGTNLDKINEAIFNTNGLIQLYFSDEDELKKITNDLSRLAISLEKFSNIAHTDRKLNKINFYESNRLLRSDIRLTLRKASLYL